MGSKGSGNSGPGGRGGSGGDGGRGGDGGVGGKGGRGGDGGNGGDGADIRVEAKNASEAQLLSLLYLNSAGGSGGSGGCSGGVGSGGEGGGGGAAGSPGPGGPGGPEGSSGQTGQNGHAGSSGSTGSSGSSGWGGSPGSSGRRGNTTYAYGGKSSSTLFTIEVMSYRVSEAAAVPLGVVEPGATIVVDQITVANTGGLPLPTGGSVHAYGLSGCRLLSTSEVEAPALEVGASATLAGRFELAVDPMPPSAAAQAPYAAAFGFALGGWMCGRPFGAGELAPTGGLSATWRAFASEVVGRSASVQKIDGVFPINSGDVMAMALPLTRGGGGSGCGGGGSSKLAALEPATLEVRLDCVGKGIFLGSEATADLPRTATMASGAPLEASGPGAAQLVPFDVACAADAPPFNLLPLKLTLVLNATPGEAGGGGGAPIVLQQWSIVVKPALEYRPEGPAGDVLLFAGGYMDADEICAWRNLVAGLGLSCDVWDVAGNFGISVDARTGAPAAWCGGRHSGKVLIVACAHDETADMLHPADVVQHLGDPALAAAIRAASHAKATTQLASKSTAAEEDADAVGGDAAGDPLAYPVSPGGGGGGGGGGGAEAASYDDDGDDAEGEALSAAAIKAPPPNHASVLVVGASAGRLTNRFFESTEGLVPELSGTHEVEAEKFVVSTAWTNVAVRACKRTPSPPYAHTL